MPDPDCPKCKGLGGYPSCPECNNADPVSSSDTPRTDAVWRMAVGPLRDSALKDFARQLERELNDANKGGWYQAGLSIAARLVSAGVKTDGIVEGVERLIEDRDELSARLIERTAAYEKKDAEQVRRIQELERGEYICRKCGLRKNAEYQNWGGF